MGKKRPSNTKSKSNERLEFTQDFIPVKDIRHGIIETTDHRYIKILEIEPIKVGARTFHRMYVKSYEYDAIFNRDGKTVIQTCISQSDEDYEYWKSLSKEEYAKAAKVFRAAAEYGNDGYSQYYLAVLYDAGAGVQKNGLAALYWLDCAVDNGAADMALADRDGLLNACRQGLSAPEFRKMMSMLSDWCELGSPDVPANPAKAVYWREQFLA